MAFFSLEDRYREIECLVFPRQLATVGPLLQPDAALLVEGNLSIREDEDPKILVSRVLPLVEDARFREGDAADAARPAAEKRTEPSVSTESARRPASRPEGKPYSKVYLRFERFDGEVYRKVCNLLDIFEDGSFPVILYDGSANRYEPFPHGVAMSDYVRRELERLLGQGNVVFR